MAGEDVIIGTPLAHRNHLELEPLIGLFANTLVLRTDLGGDPTFRELLARVREKCLGADAHPELKVHAPRRRAFMIERIESATDALSRASLHGLKHHLVADTWSQVLFYGLIGGLLFAAPPDESRSGERLTGYILVTLYMMAPMWSIMEAAPIFARARIALQKVWAADQDPHYREIFCKRLLPELKANGKTVFVISHDDRYYHLGDRVVKLEYGKVVEDRRITLET